MSVSVYRALVILRFMSQPFGEANPTLEEQSPELYARLIGFERNLGDRIFDRYWTTMHQGDPLAWKSPKAVGRLAYTRTWLLLLYIAAPFGSIGAGAIGIAHGRPTILFPGLGLLLVAASWVGWCVWRATLVERYLPRSQ